VTSLFSKASWPVALAASRAALALAALATTRLAAQDTSAASQLIILAYALYALGFLFRTRAHIGILGLLALFVDTVFMLSLSAYAGDHLSWIIAALLLFLFTEALALHGPLEVTLVASLLITFSVAVPGSALRKGQRMVVVAGVLSSGFAVGQRRKRAENASLQAQLKEAHETAARSTEIERQRIASDFHDGPLQSFISLQMRLEIVRKLLERDFQAGMEDLQQLQTLAQTQIRDLRAFLLSMRPVDVDGGNLMATARRAADAFQKETSIPVTFLGANTPVGLPREMTVEVLQMLREALHNVQKHAGASRVAVAFEKTERGLEISIDDNGHGFGFAGDYTLEELELLRLGPASLKRRARSLNADMLLESRPGRGSGLKFRIPLQ
jgi:signal transduction histidine kinase